MELGSVIQFLENRTILVTGATGFLAKIFFEKILRIQPNVKKLFLLLRAPNQKSAQQRFNAEVMEKDLLKVLKDKYGAKLNSLIVDKVSVVAGDIAHENLGIKDQNLLEEMCREVDVVINLAATTKFDERYDVALNINTFGAMHVLNFAKNCDKLKMLLHVSTAYVCGEREGVIMESPYYLGDTLNGTCGLEIETEKKMVEENLKQLKADDASVNVIKSAMKDLGIQRARKYGWPNTYVFTKAMGEMLLGNLKENINLVILRPTIISSTYKEPFPGWVEGVRTIDSVIVGYGKGKITCFLGDQKTIYDIMPADMVVNAMIVAMAAHADQKSDDEAMIYQVGSSLANPINFSKLEEYTYKYFTRHPWINKEGKSVIIGKPTILSTMASFRSYMAIKFLLPLKGLQIVNAICCQYFRPKYLEFSRKINLATRLAELYRPYLFFKARFDDNNTERLRRAAKESDEVESDIFYFDPKTINWEDYFMNAHLPGTVKYIFK